jgi:hypothetical protein
MALWQGRQLTMAHDFEAMRAWQNGSIRPFGRGDSIKLVLLYNNRWLLPDNNGSIHVCEEPCYVFVSRLNSLLLRHVAIRCAVLHLM